MTIKNGILVDISGAFALIREYLEHRARPQIMSRETSRCTALAANKIKRLITNDYQPLLVPRPGVEPGWVAPLVFETSASTDSAIWASS